MKKKIGEKKNRFDKKSVREMKMVMTIGFRMTTEQEKKHRCIKGKINK